MSKHTQDAMKTLMWLAFITACGAVLYYAIPHLALAFAYREVTG